MYYRTDFCDTKYVSTNKLLLVSGVVEFVCPQSSSTYLLSKDHFWKGEDFLQQVKKEEVKREVFCAGTRKDGFCLRQSQASAHLRTAPKKSTYIFLLKKSYRCIFVGDLRKTQIFMRNTGPPSSLPYVGWT